MRRSLLSKEKDKKRSWELLSLILLFGTLSGCCIAPFIPLFTSMLTETGAITTPWGVVYFTEDRTVDLQNHEQCHLDRLEEIGPFDYYFDYIFGGACEEEMRCGADPDAHNACTLYPLSRQPER